MRDNALSGAVAVQETEYTMQVRKQESALAELEEVLAVLGNRLEPIRFYGPDKQPPLSQPDPPDAPMSPVCDFMRHSTKKINKAVGLVKDYLNQIQI